MDLLSEKPIPKAKHMRHKDHSTNEGIMSGVMDRNILEAKLLSFGLHFGRRKSKFLQENIQKKIVNGTIKRLSQDTPNVLQGPNQSSDLKVI